MKQLLMSNVAGTYMKNALLVLVGAQLLFTSSDLLARHYMLKYGFVFSAFLSPWFLLYFILRTVGMFGQLYVFTSLELGRTMALFGAVSIILANVLGFLIIKEVLSPQAYVGVVLAVLAFLVLVFK